MAAFKKAEGNLMAFIMTSNTAPTKRAHNIDTRIARLLPLMLLLVACADPNAPIHAPVTPAAAETAEPGATTFREVLLPETPAPARLWIYLPAAPKGRIPAIFIAPAGSRMFHGMRLEQGDRPEHLPYAQAGFAVVAYDVDGPLGRKPTDDEAIAAARAFRDAEAGVANARTAIDWAVANLPEVDANRLYVAGHSSAATLALLVAAEEPRIKACIAIAPPTDLRDYLSTRMIGWLSREIPGYDTFVTSASPVSHVDELTKPMFLFGAHDDSSVSFDKTAEFAQETKRRNAAVAFVPVSEGGHYDSMIQIGIPRAIDWLKRLR